MALENAVLAAKGPKMVDFQKAFPPFYSFTIEKLLAVRGFVVRAVLFPPTIREQQGLPVPLYCNTECLGGF